MKSTNFRAPSGTGSPGRPLLARGHNARLDHLADLVRRAQGTSRTIDERVNSPCLAVTTNPFVARLTADPERTAQLREVDMATLGFVERSSHFKTNFVRSFTCARR